MPRARRWLACAIAGATIASLGPWLPAVHAKPSEGLSLPRYCAAPFNVAAQRGYDISRVAAERILTLDGVRVRLDATGWVTVHPRDPSWATAFHSLNWLVPLGLVDPRTAVDVFVERDKWLPDPGGRVSAERRKTLGWAQGQFRSRLLTATCLFSMTGDVRLIPIATRLVRANLDPARYPGLPMKEPHNHGTMSNIALVQAARVFGEPAWAEAGTRRMTRDLPAVFSECGMMREQSSSYQEHNVSLWQRASRTIPVDISSAEAALGALVRPDGVLESIGNGQPRSGMTPSGAKLWCKDTGWAAGTLDDSTHFILRFGPEVRFHGHPDRGGITWFALGVPVLSDRGLYDKTRNARYAFAHSMASHSVFEPVGFPSYDPNAQGTRLSDREYVVSDSGAGLSRERRVEFRPTSITVRDRGTGAGKWIQHWQLAPGWQPTSGGAVHRGSELKLTLDCPRMKAVRVEAFPAWRTAVDAWDLQCRVTADRSGARLATTLTVSPTG
jgi:Heparinase II/III-like protein